MSAPDTPASAPSLNAPPPSGRRAATSSLAAAVLGRLFRMRELGPAIGLLVVVAFFSTLSGNFWSPNSLTAMSTVASTVGIVSVGVTMLMISGEFDLSVGQLYAFTPIVWGILFISIGMNEWLALGIALAGSLAVGAVNGWVTTYFRIPSFIATLGMFFVLQGLNNLLISGNQLTAFEDHPTMTLLGAEIGSSPFYMPLVWLIVVAFVAWIALTRTRYGNWVFATGGRAGPAKAMGVPVDRVKRINFIFCSFLAGLAGCMQFAYLRGVTQAQGDKYELLAITAAVLGGTSLFGGLGTIVGSVIGAVLLASIEVGLVLIGAPGSFYVTFIGLMLVLVVIGNVRLHRFGNIG
ncbi:MAG: ABC transporter permease [Acidimicrobiales bacterium]